ncbi:MULTISPECIES: hypothetical protein [Pseudomonas]|uniref:hypothetical protein n=1 Tax=Pseudomonas TaxID=286 RepID=UPI00105F2B37|nr:MULTISPECIES: hypothetical protein [Pseudomonas]TDR44553.1 hypothetical protein EDF80_107193 [Pseudomonas brenneri]MDF3159497.1 hypothetical protein [Pseudomonas proteolytica]NMZ05264.1 hypothetical protein [Pseudomonas proteolytica]NMZ12752.1 hypothetical protein [Pseudomonas proteolytica]NMZ32911.1 hypothetical protein [Pseudomonas proteolytica]
MKRVLCAGLMFASFSSFAAEPIPSEPVRANAAKKPFPHISWRSDSGDSSLDIGGALRTNYRDEHWDTTENNGRFLFDTFRLDVQATYKSLYSDIGYWFQDDGKRSIDRGFVGYRLNANSNLQLGAPFKPFGLEPYPQFGWSYHLPFFMGYASSAGTGLKYSYKDQDWDVQLGFFPRMLPSDIRYSPEVGRYADLKDNAIAFTQSRQDNEKRNQLNARVARTFNSDGWKTEIGASLVTAQLYNATTKDDGDYWAAGVHAIINKGLWTVTTQAIRYEYDPENPAGVSKDSVLMGGNGLTPAYLIASKASLASVNLGYDVYTPTLGQLKKVKLYTDYSRMMKDKSAWDDSQMFTVGAQFLAMPVMAWVDFTWARNANPYGGAENGSGFTNTSSVGSNEWYYRTNVNIGYYF